MVSSAFHFAEPFWLWGLLAIPAMLLLYAGFYRPWASGIKLERFADAHLLRHLLTGDVSADQKPWSFVLPWSLVWALGMIAMAGPRWNYTDVAAFKPSANLVILLDLSRSMDAADVKPSRMTEAREKIEDAIRMAKGIHIGLVGYAADAHMISPITDDTKPILDLLPYIDTSLPHVQGNNLAPALGMASRMLGAEKGGGKSILLISDGGFRDDAAAALRDMLGDDVVLYALGVGTRPGAPIPAAGGGWIKDTDGNMVISRLNDENLRQVSAAGHGFYEQAGYTDGDVRTIMSRIESQEEAGQATGHTTRVWQEHFYLLVLAMGLLVLLWFRRGYALPVLAFLVLSLSTPQNASAAVLQDYFLNHDQQGRTLLNGGDYKKAESKFTSPYRRGIAEYRAGNYAAAEKSFSEAQTSQPEAQYNMANAQMMEGKYEDAIGTYESVLKREPKDAAAQHNLDIARKLLEKKKQEQQKQDQSKNSSEQNQKQDKQSTSSQGNKQGNGGNKQQNSQSGNSGNGSQQGKQEEKHTTQQNGGEKESAQKSTGQENQRADVNGQQKSAAQTNKGQGNSGEQQGQKSSPPSNQPQPGAQQAQAQADTHQGAAGEKPAGNGPRPQTQDNLAYQAENSQNRQAAAARLANGLTGTPPEAADAAIEQPRSRTQADINADRWLNQIDNDPQSFLKNQFLIESERNGTTQGDEPW